MKISISIPDEKLEEFKTGFLKAVPKPEHYQHLTDLQFFKQWIYDNILAAYRTGKILIAREATPPSFEDIIETIP